MARTGCASGAAISACGTARNQFRARQVLPAYGLQSLPPIHFQELTKVLFRTIPGGHFNMAENRTFLLCVDSLLPYRSSQKCNYGCSNSFLEPRLPWVRIFLRGSGFAFNSFPSRSSNFSFLLSLFLHCVPH